MFIESSLAISTCAPYHEQGDKSNVLHSLSVLVSGIAQLHYQNTAQTLAVRQVLDQSCIAVLSGGAVIGKSQILVACIKAVLWQQGYIIAQILHLADPGTINVDDRVGGPEGDDPPGSCLLVVQPMHKWTTCCNLCTRRVTATRCSVRRCSQTFRHPSCAYVPNGPLPHQDSGHLTRIRCKP